MTPDDQLVAPPENLGGLLRRALSSGSFVAGLLITLAIVAMALVSFLWTPYDITNLVVADRMKPMLAQHLFGTDHFGRDILSMIMIGARNSIAVALVAVAIGMGIGVPLGCWAAARGGFVDEALMRFNDVVFAFPALMLAIMITAVFGPGAFNAIVAIGIFNIPVFARVARAGALSIWPREFILAARASGKGPALITIEHILPNIANLLLVQGTIQFALGILAEAGLSYLGLGAQPPMPSWGRMLFDAQTRMVVAPHLAIFPGLAIVITVMGLNLLGDGLADILDPRLRRRRQ
jgi:peptide/nickel transport system permease protein